MFANQKGDLDLYHCGISVWAQIFRKLPEKNNVDTFGFLEQTATEFSDLF